MEFLQSSDLREEYIAYGRFYLLKYNDSTTKECRSFLEIFKKNEYDVLKGTNEIDAVVIMMNPGSGEPLVNTELRSLNVKQVKGGVLNQIELVETRMDDTQDQVMRVMKKMGWSYVRVINLSDYRNSDSEKFYPTIKEAESYDRDFIHSIFSRERSEEINGIFKSENDKEFKIITAWGVNTKLHKLIKLAVNNSNLSERLGYNKDTIRKKNFYYYHPLPRNPLKQPIWLDKVLKKL